MKILPQKYDELLIGRFDKQLIALLKSIYKDNATLLLCCNPTKTIGGIVHIIITSRGLAFLHMKSDVKDTVACMDTIFTSINSVKNEEDILSARFQAQNSLVKKGSIIFPYKVVTFFPDCEKPNLEVFAGVQALTSFVNETCLFKDFWRVAQIERGFIDHYLFGTNTEVITDEIIPDIINRVAPEYTIPRIRAAVDVNRPQHTPSSVMDSNSTFSDRAAIAYMLDESQIDYINRIKKGDQLIIACAGSGKSVLLISKCFKVAAINPDKHFLITGYNRNFISYFRWLIDSAGFSTNNVECLTFDSLCIKLLKDNNIRVPSTPQGDYSRVREIFIQNLESGHIHNRYYGIFIDEVQMFKPEWYKACYDLIENKDSEEHFFVICGDKSQSVKTSIKSGKAPWQGHGIAYPSFRGKSFPIEINYRNSIEINNFIRRFTDKALEYAKMLHIPVNQDADIFLRGKSQRAGLSLEYHEIDQRYLDSEAEAITVLNQIIDIHNNFHIPYDSIAVICYNRSYNFIQNRAERNYKPIEHLKNYLNQVNIPYSLLNSANDEYGTSFANIEGVPIVTMESSLGLDFEAVIVCGLVPLGIHDGTKTLKEVREKCTQETTINAFNRNINILYMALSRAKDILRIVSGETEKESIYIRILKDAFFQEG